MAMTSRLWSINALATELDMDRRTIAQRLRAVPPDGQIQGHPAWRLTTALRTLDDEPVAERDGAARRPERSMPACLAPFGGQMTTSGHSVHEAVAATLIGVVQDTPHRIASLAVGAGADMALAYTLFHAAGYTLAAYADELIERCRTEWRHEDHFFAPIPPDWAALAEVAGEEVDEKAWAEYAKSAFGGGSAQSSGSRKPRRGRKNGAT